MSTGGNLPRRDFLKGAIAGALSGLSGCGGGSQDVVSLEPRLEGDHGSWTFIGSEDWSQDSQGVLFSPVWNQRKARYGDLLKREDFAFPSKEVLTNTDLSLEFQTFYWSVTNLSIIVRAQDDRRFYCVQFNDMGRKGSSYAVRLYVQDGSGYRREIASGFAPHPGLPERWVQRGPRPEEWGEATPGWMKARVQAEGNRIRVFMDGKQVLEARDETYGAGRAGVMARGPVKMRCLSLQGRRSRLDSPWSAAGEEHPRYFYPYPDPDKVYGDNQTYPGVCRTAGGDLLVWMSVNGDPHRFNDFLLVRSRDEGRSWGEPVLVEKLPDGGRPGFFFGHRDGRLSCLYTYGWKSEVAGPKVAFSKDEGRTWTPALPLEVSGKPLYAAAREGEIGPYSPITRYSDGTLLQFYNHVQTVAGGSVESNAERRDRSLAIRSTDDGRTWTGPYYLDPENFDSNECMGVECSDGSIVAFARTLRAPFMWMSRSGDKGLTWSRQAPSDCTGECPQLLRHSSGVLIMGSRGAGIFMKTSVDEGRSWSRETRVSLCSGMMGLTEMKDGRVLVVFHEAYRTPTRIRGHYMRVNADGSLRSA